MLGFWRGFALGGLAVLVATLVGLSLVAGSPPGLPVMVGLPPPALIRRDEASLLPSLLAAVAPAVANEARREMASARVSVVVQNGRRRLDVPPASLRPLQSDLSAWMVKGLSHWLESPSFRRDLLKAATRDPAISRTWMTLWEHPWHVRVGPILSLWITVRPSPQSSR